MPGTTDPSAALVRQWWPIASKTAGAVIVSRVICRDLAVWQVDGYAAYNRLAKGTGGNDGVTLAACFAHVRRRFYELHVNESSHLAT